MSHCPECADLQAKLEDLVCSIEEYLIAPATTGMQVLREALWTEVKARRTPKALLKDCEAENERLRKEIARLTRICENLEGAVAQLSVTNESLVEDVRALATAMRKSVAFIDNELKHARVVASLTNEPA